MSLILILLLLLQTTRPYNIGLLLDTEFGEYTSVISNVADYTTNRLDPSVIGNVTLITELYNSSSYISLSRSLCRLVEQNISAVVSASGSSKTRVEAEVLSSFHIPYISTVATNPFLMNLQSRDYLLLLSPSDRFQSQAIFDILARYDWREFSILASSDDYGINGVLYLQYLATHNTEYRIKDVQHFEVLKDVSAMTMIQELTLIRESLAKVIVVNCEAKYAKTIFREARELGLMDDGYVWIVTDGVISMVQDLAYEGNYYPRFYEGLLGTIPAYGVGSTNYEAFAADYTTEHGAMSDIDMTTVLVSDGIRMVHQALENLEGSTWNNTPSLQCTDPTARSQWSGGNTLLEKLKQLSFNGTSGQIVFSEDGITVMKTYDINSFRNGSFVKVGSWSCFNGTSDLQINDTDLVFLGGQDSPPPGLESTLTGHHLKIGILPEAPIAFLRSNCSDMGNTSSPTCWYGWNPDIITRLATDLNFTYEYVQPEDNKWGGYDETNGWNGIVRDIVDRKIDMTIALAINSERSQYISFTSSFFEDQAAFTFVTDSYHNPFFFLLPFDSSVWVVIVLIMWVLSFLLTLVNKISPYGSYGKKVHALQSCTCENCTKRRDIKDDRQCRFEDMDEPQCRVDCVEKEDCLEAMSVGNSAWIVTAGFVQQGGDGSFHDAPSGRLLIFIWWLFVMILTSMYTANLTAHLTLERSVVTIEELPDLLEQSTYEWGIIRDRNMESMMLTRDDKDYLQIVRRATSLVDVEDGIEKAGQGNFVFIDESSVLTYNFKMDCQAVQTNTGKFNNEWAFGLQMYSPYQSVINTKFLEYREMGWFTELWNHWYSSGDSCDFAEEYNGRFDMEILKGLFYILSVGVMLSLLLVVWEMAYAAFADSGENSGNFCARLRARLTLKKHEIIREWLEISRGPQKMENTNDQKIPFNKRSSLTALLAIANPRHVQENNCKAGSQS